MAKAKPVKKTKTDLYLDSSEDFLNNFFDKPESEKISPIDNLLKTPDLPWAIRYHLSPQRHMLLNWYPFRESSSLLEIGAGCGALTGLFLEKLSEVTCNELSPSRAEIIKKRFKDRKNLSVYSGDINDFKSKKKFDYVTLVGVLEYAGKYSKSTSPYEELLTTTRRLLKPTGRLLLAIENKIGLKYLSGAPEDHTGIVFDSLENYPQDHGIRTFTRQELLTLLENSGFNEHEFYYPFPDYKLPQIVFSETGLQSLNKLTKSTITATVDYSTTFDQLFNEVALSHLLAKEDVLHKFSNSFLVDASI
jgi:SAM-dependent methyltransferase